MHTVAILEKAKQINNDRNGIRHGRGLGGCLVRDISELSEMMDGFIINSWFNYIHQHSQLQFPVQTAKEFEMTSFVNNGSAFKTIQTALQLTTHGEFPELF